MRINNAKVGGVCQAKNLNKKKIVQLKSNVTKHNLLIINILKSLFLYV